MRRPAVSGQFYAGKRDELRKQIQECFTSKIGPGLPPKTPGSARNVLGLVVPHAGYVYSGPVAAWSYHTLFADGRPDALVILGPNHHGVGSGISLFPEGDWETPLGTASVEAGLAEAILEASSIVDRDTRAHFYEHSIEVQIPFLQYLFGSVNFVPISMMLQDLDTALEVSRDIATAVASYGRKVTIIASTDFSHYVRPEVAQANDHAAIGKIISMDSEGLYRVIEERNISMCGYGPVMVAIEVCSMQGVKQGTLLKYATSGDIMPMKEVVGYACIAFSRP